MKKQKWFKVTYWLEHRPATRETPIVESVGAANGGHAASKIHRRYKARGYTASVLKVERFHPEIG